MQHRIMVLGSGELGKEFIIAAKRMGIYVVAVDRYANTPGMQVADDFAVIDMLDGKALDEVVKKFNPNIIVPEIEAIRTQRLTSYEEQGIQIVPSAKAVQFTMDRKKIRNLAAYTLGLKTAQFEYATSLEELISSVQQIGLPCVVKPLMSSSGKGQSIVRNEDELEQVWKNALKNGRGDQTEVIVEQFIPFESEITLLTVTQKNGQTLFCPPIGHRQENGDYRESWQPHYMKDQQILKAEQMAKTITQNLGGAGIWGVEFFLTKDEVYFSELSPRPHDTGMVTLANTQSLNEFELHLRAILGLPIPELHLKQVGASAVILSDSHINSPIASGLERACQFTQSDLRIFGKPEAYPGRRMGVALAYDQLGVDPMLVVKKAKNVAQNIKIIPDTIS